MKQTLVYILILVALGTGVWYIFFRNDSDIFTAKDAAFTIKDTAAIGKIFLADNTNQTVLLERTPNGWKLNNKYKALPSAVNLLLFTLNKQVAQRPVPEQAHNDVVRRLANSNKVEVYDRSGNRMRIFYVGTETPGFTGTYMIMEGGSRPYVVQIPGFEGYLTPRYMPIERFWRDRMVFDIDAKDISRVSVQYMLEPLNSFTVTNTTGKPQVTVDPALMMEGKPVNERRANSFLTFFKNVNSESVASGLQGVRESISKVPKLCVIDVAGKNGYRQHADIYFMPKNKRSKNNGAPVTDTASKYNSDRFYAVINNKEDTVAVQIQVFEKFFRKGYEFFMEDEPVASSAPAMGTQKK
jgi:hypothetical protein